MTDDVTKRAAQLLLKGAKMLPMACPICHEPIYQLKDSTMLCVRCNRKVEFGSSSQTSTNVTSSIQSPPPTTSDHPIQQKISQLSAQLQEETDPDKVVKLAETIRKLEHIMRS